MWLLSSYVQLDGWLVPKGLSMVKTGRDHLLLADHDLFTPMYMGLPSFPLQVQTHGRPTGEPAE